MSFSLPINAAKLQSDRLRLIAFEDNFDEWASVYVEETSRAPDLMKWLPYGPFANIEVFKNWHAERFSHDRATQLFAIVLKAGSVTKVDKATGVTSAFDVEEGTLAGTVGILDAKPHNSSAEIGHLVIFPRFQRTFVGTHAHGIIIRYLLDDFQEGGMNMRRVQWHANASNEPSINAAKRLGFSLEGIIRWHRVMAEGKAGSVGLREEGLPMVDMEGKQLGAGRHTAQLSLCWDDWVDGAAEKIDELMRR